MALSLTGFGTGIANQKIVWCTQMAENYTDSAGWANA